MNRDKQRDTFRVEIPTERQLLTKRSILKSLASICDPLQFISPVLLIGKILFRNLCDLRILWDNDIPQEIENTWVKWVNGLNIHIEISRSTSIRETITNIDICLFSDGSINGECTVAYAAIYRPNTIKGIQVFVSNRVAKIREHSYLNWNYVPTRNNPADLVS